MINIIILLTIHYVFIMYLLVIVSCIWIAHTYRPIFSYQFANYRSSFFLNEIAVFHLHLFTSKMLLKCSKDLGNWQTTDSVFSFLRLRVIFKSFHLGMHSWRNSSVLKQGGFFCMFLFKWIFFALHTVKIPCCLGINTCFFVKVFLMGHPFELLYNYLLFSSNFVNFFFFHSAVCENR